MRRDSCRRAVRLVFAVHCCAFLVYVGRLSNSSVTTPQHVQCSTNNNVISKYDAHIKEQIALLVAKQATANDQDLIQLVKYLLYPPSSHPVMLTYPVPDTVQAVEIDNFFNPTLVQTLYFYYMSTCNMRLSCHQVAAAHYTGG